MKNIEKRNEFLAKKVITAFEKRNFNAFYAASRGEAFKQILNLIDKNDVVGWGGSVTVDELKIKEYLEENGYTVINRDKAKSKEEKRELALKCLSADVFLMSSNAITEDGELVNIDGQGNRIAALCFGPKKVIVVAGMNKIVKSLDDAIQRARNYAAPVNAQRVASHLGIQTPCVTAGACYDCKSQTSICSNILTTRLSFPQGRINVILVNDYLGY